MQFLLLFYGNNGYANAPQKYVLHTLFILLYGNKKTRRQHKTYIQLLVGR